jgi:hypothetical protein
VFCDLQGSTQGRVSKVSKKNGKRGILKDVDLETSGQMIRIGPARKWFFMQQLRNDAAVRTLSVVFSFFWWTRLIGVVSETAPAASKHHGLQFVVGRTCGWGQ